MSKLLSYLKSLSKFLSSFRIFRWYLPHLRNLSKCLTLLDVEKMLTIFGRFEQLSIAFANSGKTVITFPNFEGISVAFFNFVQLLIIFATFASKYLPVLLFWTNFCLILPPKTQPAGINVSKVQTQELYQGYAVWDWFPWQVLPRQTALILPVNDCPLDAIIFIIFWDYGWLRKFSFQRN